MALSAYKRSKKKAKAAGQRAYHSAKPTTKWAGVEIGVWRLTGGQFIASACLRGANKARTGSPKSRSYKRGGCGMSGQSSSPRTAVAGALSNLATGIRKSRG